MKFKNLTPIPNNIITQMGKQLKLQWLFPVIIVENPELPAAGTVRYDEETEICFVILQNGRDRSSLIHELRHVWQMEQMSPDVCRVIYELEQKTVGYQKNALEQDAFDWEKKWQKKRRT